jgi:hypothetical protein
MVRSKYIKYIRNSYNSLTRKKIAQLKNGKRG